MAGQGSVAPLAGDDGGDALFLEPAEQAAKFRADDVGVGQGGEQRLDGVQHHALGADLVDGGGEADEQTVQVVFAGLHDLAAIDLHLVDHELLVGGQRGQIVAERGDVLGQIGGAFLEAHEGAVLAVLLDAADQELHADQRLAGTGATADQRGAPAREAAAGDDIQAVDAGGAFRELDERWRGRLGTTTHWWALHG